MNFGRVAMSEMVTRFSLSLHSTSQDGPCHVIIDIDECTPAPDNEGITI